MHLYATPMINYDDDRYRSIDYPLRTELLMEAFSSICQDVTMLNVCITPTARSFQPFNVKYYSDRLEAVFYMLNRLERFFLEWLMSVGMFSNREDNNHNLSVLAIKNTVDGSIGLEGSIKYLSRLAQCFNNKIIADHYPNTYQDVMYDECETTGSFHDPDKLYNIEYRNLMEYMFQEFLACYNAISNAKNRDNLKNYRTCEKCGTTFQRSKSRNMHYPKCNGVNRGYYVGKTSEKISDW